MSPLSDYWKALPSHNPQSSYLRLHCPHHVAQIGFASLYFHLISIHWTCEGTKAGNISWRFHDTRSSRRGVMRGRGRVHITRLQGPAAVARRLLWSLDHVPFLLPWAVGSYCVEGGCCLLLLWREEMGGLSRAHLRGKVEAVVALGPVECSPVRTPTRSGDCTKPPGSQQPLNQPGPQKSQTSWRKRPVVLETIWDPE